MRKESIRDRLETEYITHYGQRKGYFLAGSLPRQQGTWFDSSPEKNHGAITNAKWGRLNSGMWYLDFDGAGDFVTFPASAKTVKTFMAWVYIDTKNKSIADFDTGTHSVETENTPKLQATGWNAPTYYVNGTATDAIATGAWKHICVTTSTAFAMAALVLGKEASEYDGKMALVFISSDKLAAGDVKEHYLEEKHLFES
jgi:hypothetical protein